MTDSIVFYRSYYDAVKNLPPEQFKTCITALLEYAFNDDDTTADATAEMYLTLTKPLVDANKARRRNGKKGGRKPKENFDDLTGYKPVDWNL